MPKISPLDYRHEILDSDSLNDFLSNAAYLVDFHRKTCLLGSFKVRWSGKLDIFGPKIQIFSKYHIIIHQNDRLFMTNPLVFTASKSVEVVKSYGQKKGHLKFTIHPTSGRGKGPKEWHESKFLGTKWKFRQFPTKCNQICCSILILPEMPSDQSSVVFSAITKELWRHVELQAKTTEL